MHSPSATRSQAHGELSSLPLSTREQLLQLACVAAWSDTEVASEERAVVLELAEELALGERGARQARAWLAGPPPWFDPAEVPREHRQLFVDALLRVIRADGVLDDEECETLRLIRELVK